MSKANLKYLVPNGITFAALALGVGALLAAAQEELVLSGTLIFISYWMDMLDGMAARKLDARSEFGCPGNIGVQASVYERRIGFVGDSTCTDLCNLRRFSAGAIQHAPAKAVWR
jgi:hypothetical protein